MFRSEQIITSSELIKHFRKISRYMKDYPAPVLISQKGGAYLVLVPAEIFEEMLDEKLAKDGVKLGQAFLRQYLDAKF